VWHGRYLFLKSSIIDLLFDNFLKQINNITENYCQKRFVNRVVKNSIDDFRNGKSHAPHCWSAVVVQQYTYIVALPLPDCIQCNYVAALYHCQQVNNQQCWAWLSLFLKSSIYTKLSFIKFTVTMNNIINLKATKFGNKYIL
jgi:hypothetical protein